MTDETNLTLTQDALLIDQLEVSTDQADYAPGSTATITVNHVTVGGTIEFAIADDAADPGDDGDADIYPTFTATDGGIGDLDGLLNGVIVANWLVPTDGSPKCLSGESLNRMNRL